MGSSWYVEWGGYQRQGQPGWLEPSLFCFLAGFSTIDFERKLGGGSLDHGAHADDDRGESVPDPGYNNGVALKSDDAESENKDQFQSSTAHQTMAAAGTSFGRRSWARARMLLGLW